MHRCTISHIDPDSPLRHAAHPGDRLVSINGNPITDVLDYKYYAYDPELAVCLRRPDGTEHTVHVSKPLGGELGLDFETYLMDNAHSCANHCVFCFIDQMPPGMRPTLYFKDDDARLSFLMGNYMTLTNLSEREVQRIIHLHISPINVSVHATDPELRSFLLGNPRAGKTLDGANLELYADVRADYPQVDACVEKICGHIRDEWGCVVTDEERLYIFIHANRLRAKEENN